MLVHTRSTRERLRRKLWRVDRVQSGESLEIYLFLIPSIIFSGFATPIANMPQTVQYLTLMNPMLYFLLILRSVFLEGGSILLLWPEYWPMAIIAVINLALAAWLFRHRMY